MNKIFSSIGIDDSQYGCISISDRFPQNPNLTKHNLTIICSEKLGYVYKDHTLSLLDFIEFNDVYCRNLYFDFFKALNLYPINESSIHDYLLLRHDLSLWSLSSVNEHYNCVPGSGFNDLLKFLVIKVIIENLNISEISFGFEKTRLINTIKLYAFSNYISSSYSFMIRRIYMFFLFPKILTSYLKSFSYLVFFALKYNPFFGQPKCKAQRFWSNSVTIHNYLLNVPSADVNNHIFKSPYWGDLVKLLSDSGLNLNWIHFYIPDKSLPTSADAVSYINDLNSHSQGFHYSIYSSFNLKIAANVFKSFLSIQFRCFTVFRKLFSSSSEYLLPLSLIHREFLDSLFGPHALKVINYLHLFETFFESIPFQHLGLYLQENLAWEKTFNYCWRKFNHGVLIGVPHSTIRFWDLRYSNTLSCPLDIPSMSNLYPNLYISNSHKMTKFLTDIGISPDRVIKLEALRYTYLYKTTPSRTSNSTPGITLLVLGDYLPSTFERQILLLRNAIDKIDVLLNIIVKPHPFCKFDSALIPPSWHVSSDSLQNLLPSSTIAFVGGITSAVLDVYEYGLACCYISDKHNLDLCPLRGESNIVSVSTSDNLSSFLVADASQLPHKSRSSFFYNSHDLAMWRQFISASI